MQKKYTVSELAKALNMSISGVWKKIKDHNLKTVKDVGYRGRDVTYIYLSEEEKNVILKELNQHRQQFKVDKSEQSQASQLLKEIELLKEKFIREETLRLKAEEELKELKYSIELKRANEEKFFTMMYKGFLANPELIKKIDSGDLPEIPEEIRKAFAATLVNDVNALGDTIKHKINSEKGIKQNEQ